jgi:hypothetical protein
MEPVHEVVHQQKQEAIHHKNEQPKRENNERRRKQEQDRTEERVQNSEEERRADERADTVITDTTDNPSCDHNRDGGDCPTKEKMPHDLVEFAEAFFMPISSCAGLLSAYRLAEVEEK